MKKTSSLDTIGAPNREPAFGHLAANRSDPGHILIFWLGRSGIRLQSCSNLAIEVGQDHAETDELSATNWPFPSEDGFSAGQTLTLIQLRRACHEPSRRKLNVPCCKAVAQEWPGPAL